jgi:hypothetical protein
MEDHVPILRRLRWGEVSYANLRYRNGPNNRLKWKCGHMTDDQQFKKFDCNWVGNWIYPGTLKPRKEKLITPMNKDEWVDSIELAEVLLSYQSEGRAGRMSISLISWNSKNMLMPVK